jgi:hypothetical protein
MAYRKVGRPELETVADVANVARGQSPAEIQTVADVASVARVPPATEILGQPDASRTRAIYETAKTKIYIYMILNDLMIWRGRK